MILSLSYGDLSGTVTETNRLVSELGQYCDELSRKVQQKMYSVEGGMSSALNSADYYVNAKIRQLRARESNARNLSAKTQTLLDTAKRVDESVKSTIEANQKSFFQKNPELKSSDFQLWLTSFYCDMKNVPILGNIIGWGEQVYGGIVQLGKDIKHWWKCGGGQELVVNCLDIVLRVGLAVAAVVVAVGAVAALLAATVVTGGAILFAVAACVAAVIAVVNAGTNIVTSAQAIGASQNGDPAMAKIYGERDSLAQVLREENFHNPILNRLSNTAATVLDFTEAAAGVVLLVHSIGKIAGSFLSKNGVGFAFKELVHGADGKLTSKVTLSSIWKGTKAMILNQKLTTSTSAGLRTTLITNVKQTISNWSQMKQLGDLGHFKNIIENIRYNSTLFKGTDLLTKITEIADMTSRGLSGVLVILDGFSFDRIKEAVEIHLSLPAFDKLFPFYECARS
ncbi:MAG: hypothetical protein LBK56_02670 [Gracilibacteraceae bacterium]|jgi:hypothetical protein|nr:hypothetical protein [Gracilibacteraceae bacterium]